MNLKNWIKGRPDKWGQLRRYLDDNDINKKINWTVIILETLFVIFVLNSWYGCQCNFRTCELKQLERDGVTVKWEAINLDCQYVQKYLQNEVDKIRDAENPENWILPNDTATWNEIQNIKLSSYKLD